MEIASMIAEVGVLFRWGDRFEFFRETANVKKRKRFVTRAACRIIKCFSSVNI